MDRPFLRACFLVAVVGLIFSIGCASKHSSRKIIKAPETRLIKDVPNEKIKFNDCGPVSLHMVYKYWGRDTDLDQIREDVRLDEKRGTLIMDMLLYSRRQGLSASVKSGDLKDLEEAVASGIPPILMIKSGPPKAIQELYPPNKVLPLITHYIVLVGYNPNEKVFIYNGPKKRKAISYDELSKRWRYTDQALIIIQPKEKP